MIWHGIGAGFTERTGADFRMAYDLEYHRPAHTVGKWFHRRINSRGWKPIPFGDEAVRPMTQSTRRY
jgi:hypothetical protein